MLFNMQYTKLKKVLVIDDDEGVCCLVEDILAEQGIDVVKAIGGEKGIRILTEEFFPVVITDLRMPDIDGFGIIDYIHKRKLQSLVVVITGYVTIDNAIEALRLGAYDYVIKPFSPDLLTLTVKKAFDFLGLIEKQEKIKQLEIITQMASTTAHEVSQPLTVLMGQANEIQKTTRDEKIREMAQQVLSEARNISNVIRKIENLQEYVTKTFPGGHTIIDIDKGTLCKD
ncbi:MAG: response regulator [Deltaproteobacteria bacterium]|nr:response regulator [Deltaproteobacteria bacterium]